jgi:hypothetical protein
MPYSKPCISVPLSRLIEAAAQVHRQGCFSAIESCLVFRPARASKESSSDRKHACVVRRQVWGPILVPIISGPIPSAWFKILYQDPISSSLEAMFKIL